jgi:cbb3-type cytochrome oxidase subunit 3
MIILMWLWQHMILVMLVVFAVLAVHAYLPSRRAQMEKCGEIPLNDDI